MFAISEYNEKYLFLLRFPNSLKLILGSSQFLCFFVTFVQLHQPFIKSEFLNTRLGKKYCENAWQTVLETKVLLSVTIGGFEVSYYKSSVYEESLVTPNILC